MFFVCVCFRGYMCLALTSTTPIVRAISPSRDERKQIPAERLAEQS